MTGNEAMERVLAQRAAHQEIPTPPEHHAQSAQGGAVPQFPYKPKGSVNMTEHVGRKIMHAPVLQLKGIGGQCPPISHEKMKMCTKRVQLQLQLRKNNPAGRPQTLGPHMPLPEKLHRQPPIYQTSIDFAMVQIHHGPGQVLLGARHEVSPRSHLCAQPLRCGPRLLLQSGPLSVIMVPYWGYPKCRARVGTQKGILILAAGVL